MVSVIKRSVLAAVRDVCISSTPDAGCPTRFGSVRIETITESRFELDWYESVDIEGLTVTGVPAIHMSRRGLTDMNKTLWCGFALQTGHSKVYFAGDTAYGPVFKQIGQIVGPFDLGLVPIGAYQPRSLMRMVHTTPEEAVAIGEDIRAKKLIGMHWGTIRLTTEPMMEPKTRFLEAHSDIPRQTLRIGETVEFD